MTRLEWDSRIVETGLDRGVIYPQEGDGEAWNGLISVDADSSSSSNRGDYMDGRRFRNRQSRPGFEGTISAYTYPDALDQANRKPFGMSYRVRIGTSYKIHLVYNVLLGPSPRSSKYNEADPFQWPFTTRPVPVPGGKVSAHLIVDTSIAYPSTVAAFEDLLYGDDAMGLPTLPLPTEVDQIFEDNALFQVVDMGNGLWSVTGPGVSVLDLGDHKWQLTWPSVVEIDEHLYNVYSY